MMRPAADPRFTGGCAHGPFETRSWREEEVDVVVRWRCSKRGRLKFPAGLINWRAFCPWIFLLFMKLFCAGCAKTGEPQPPIIYIPKPSLDLECRQVSGQVRLSVSLPRENTNGTPVNTLKRVEVFRLDSDPAQKAALLAEDEFLKAGIKILSIPEEDFPRYKHDDKFVFSDALEYQKGSEIYSRALIYAVRFINNKKQTAGLGNRVSLVPVPIPSAPTFLPVEISQNSIRLRWATPAENLNGSKPARIFGYNVYRSEDSKGFAPAPLNMKPLQQPEFDDRNFEFDKNYGYAVSIVASEKPPFAESLTSEALFVTPRDTFPPGAPKNLNAVFEGGAVILLWTAPPDGDVAGYRVYRRDNGAVEKNLLQKGLVTTLSYRDVTAQPGRKYEYNVTAVDTHNNESETASAAVDLQ
jgi:hypothetical protein